MWSFAGAAVIGSCNLHNEGVTPDPAVISYPIALALSSEQDAPPRFLYVANSNFDLRYNSGSVQAYDLSALDGLLTKYGCRELDKDVPLGDGGVRTFPDNTRYPMAALDAGAMELDAGDPGDPQAPLADAGEDAGSLADAGMSGLDASADADVDAGPRGSADAGVIEIAEDYAATSLYGNKRGVLCDERDSPEYAKCCFYRRDPARDPTVTDRGLDDIRKSAFRIDSYATGIAVANTGAGRERVYIPISGRSRLVYLDAQDGALSCGEETGRCTRGPGRGRDDDVPDDSFPGQPTAMAVGSLQALAPEGQLPIGELTGDMTFIATAHDRGGFSLFVDKGGAPVLESVLRGFADRPTSVVFDPRHRALYLTASRESYISRIALRVDDGASVDMAEPPPRELLYESTRIYVTGLAQAGDLRDVAIDPNDPARLYALVRASQAVAFLALDPTVPGGSEARLIDAVPVGSGPSKLLYIALGGRSFLLVSCYDDRSIHIIDTTTRKPVAIVRNLSGPFEMVFDASRRLLHVADFRASVLRVVDLAGLVDKREPPPRIVATLGSPRFEGGLE